jgi:hypothetical protein
MKTCRQISVLLFLFAFLPLLSLAQPTRDLSYDTIPLKGNSRFNESFKNILRKAHENVINGSLPAYRSPLCEQLCTKAEAILRSERRVAIEVFRDPANPYGGIVDTFVTQINDPWNTDAVSVAYECSPRGETDIPWSITFLFDSFYGVDPYLPSRTSNIYSVKFSDLKNHFSSREVGILNSYLKNPGAGSSITYDTLSVNHFKEGAAFRKIFLQLDTMARSNRISTYKDQLLGNLLDKNEVKRIGQGEEVIQVLLDLKDPYAGTIDSIVLYRFAGEAVKQIVVAYECYDPQGRLYFTPQPFSLCILRQSGRDLSACAGCYNRVYFDIAYCLSYEEIKTVLSKKQMRVVEEYLRDSPDICR